MNSDDRDRSWRDEDRPSWKEIDKQRDRSGTSRQKDKPAFTGNKKEQVWARQMALREADKLFNPQKTKEQLKAEKVLEAAKGTAQFGALAKKFYDEYGVTNDWHTQLLLAEAPASAIAIEAIEALIKAAATLEAAEKRVITTQLNILGMTAKTKIKMAAKAALDTIK